MTNNEINVASYNAMKSFTEQILCDVGFIDGVQFKLAMAHYLHQTYDVIDATAQQVNNLISEMGKRGDLRKLSYAFSIANKTEIGDMFYSANANIETEVRGGLVKIKHTMPQNTGYAAMLYFPTGTIITINGVT